MTRIVPFDGLPHSGPPGLAASRTRGLLFRTALMPISAKRVRAGSAFESRSRSMPHAGRSLTLSAIGIGIGVAASAAVVSGLATSTAAALCALLRDSGGRGRVRLDPAALHLHCTPARPPEAAESVSVLIPVRHEPDPAVAAVRAALCQRGVDHLDVVVLDDGCPLETRAALRREFADDPRVRILAAAPLPRGWSPLAHRSHQLAVAARGRVLIFAEPCAPLGPHAAASATALLRGEQLDLAVLDTGRPAPARHVSARDEDAHASAGPGTGNVKSPPAGEGAHASVGRGHSSKAATAGSDALRPAADRPHPRHRTGHTHGGLGRFHPGRFTVAVDAEAYWRIGGYRAAATDPDPLALMRTVRRASGRVAVADGRRVIPPAQLLEPLPAPDPVAEARWDSQHSSRASLTGSARRVLAALVGARA